MRHRLIILWILCWLSLPAMAQQYIDTSGLIQVPSADMGKEGDARIGVHFLHREFTPDVLEYDESKYHTMSYYLSITPFRWMEIGYTCTLLRSTREINGVEDPDDVGLYKKDRFFSLKLQPIHEKNGKWWPSLAVGVNDPYSAGSSYYFCNIYLAVSKHFVLKRHELGFHLAYRRWKGNENAKWNGLVEGITYRPSFAKNLRVVAEYTGEDINVGADCLLWNHLLLQVSLQNGRYVSGGICFLINLL